MIAPIKSAYLSPLLVQFLLIIPSFSLQPPPFASSSSLLSMLSKLPLPFPVTIVFLKLQRKCLKSFTQNSIQNAFLFLSGDIHSDNLPLQRSNVEWITPELSIESLIQCNKGQMSLKVKTFISKAHCPNSQIYHKGTLKGSCFNKNVTLF